MASRGVLTATFDFPYMATGRKLPNPAPILEQTWRDVIAAAGGHPAFAGLPLYIGGKSMGGRIASQTAAAGEEPIAGLVFLGYPLHPPGKPQQRRDAHLPSITAPMLFVQGTRDPFGRAEEIRELLPRLHRSELYEVDGADHSFRVPASLGKPQAQVLNDIYDRVADFLR